MVLLAVNIFSFRVFGKGEKIFWKQDILLKYRSNVNQGVFKVELMLYFMALSDYIFIPSSSRVYKPQFIACNWKDTRDEIDIFWIVYC